MGTRGAYGFRINREDKVTYNHYDSYPENLGQSIVDFISNTLIAEMKEIAERIILVDGNSKPTAEQKREIGSEWCDLGVSEQTENDWYCLIRETQGDLGAYQTFDGSDHPPLRYMIDRKDFLNDSLFCEWAYIINLDEEVLEIYVGFNKNLNANGRYAKNSFDSESDNKYYGVELIKKVPLGEIQGKVKSKTKIVAPAIEEFLKEYLEREARETDLLLDG